MEGRFRFSTAGLGEAAAAGGGNAAESPRAPVEFYPTREMTAEGLFEA